MVLLTTVRILLVSLGAAATASVPGTACALADKITTFAVNDFSTCATSSLPNPIPAAGRFRNALIFPLQAPAEFQLGYAATDDDVWDVDMSDPEWGGNPAFADQSSNFGFDTNSRAGVVLVQTHGCGGPADGGSFADGTGNGALELCNSTADCTNPTGNLKSAARCSRYPVRSPCPANENCTPFSGVTSPICNYHFEHAITICGPGGPAKCKAQNRFSAPNRIDYSLTQADHSTLGTAPKEMRLGDGSAWSSAWGTNGGAQFAIILASHTTHMGSFYHDMGGLFGGLDAVAATWDHGGDYADSGFRAQGLASQMDLFPDRPLSDAWMEAADYPNVGGLGCNGWKKDGTPRQGINGCGGHVFMVVGGSQSEVNSRMDTYDIWQLRDLGIAPSGRSWTATRWTCNFDCNTFPPLVNTAEQGL